MRNAEQPSYHLPLSASFLLVALCLVWGGNMVSIKLSLYGLPPILSAAARSLAASLILGAYLYATKRPAFMDAENVIHGVAVGALFGTEFLFLYWGTSFTDVSRAVVFLYTQPLWVAVGAHYLLPNDRLSRVKVVGLAAAFTGLVLVFQSRSGGLQRWYWVGDLMETAAGFLWAATSLYIKKYMLDKNISHYQTLFSQLFYSIPILGVGVLLFEPGARIVLDRLTIGTLVYQTVIVAFLSYLLWFWMVHRYQISILSAFTFLTPLFGVLLSGLILGEPLPLMLWLGLILVASGIYLVNKPSLPRDA
uniref:DMT family transporter n=1 Tax=Desulfomonile tiedjei TaxID=2358 RepID=A0A7C4EWI0_9BACT